jgi:hypothetical protein
MPISRALLQAIVSARTIQITVPALVGFGMKGLRPIFPFLMVAAKNAS